MLCTINNTDTIEFRFSGYAPLTPQIQWNYNYRVMHRQSHRHNGISILGLCTTNHTDTMELQLSGYAQLTTQIQWNFQPSGYAPLTTQIQLNFTPMVMHH